MGCCGYPTWLVFCLSVLTLTGVGTTVTGLASYFVSFKSMTTYNQLLEATIVMGATFLLFAFLTCCFYWLFPDEEEKKQVLEASFLGGELPRVQIVS